MTKPIPVARSMAGTQRSNSPAPNPAPPPSFATSARDRTSSSSSTSPTANRPMATTVKSIPPSSSRLPKVKRSTPVPESTPTRASSSPRHPAAHVLAALPGATAPRSESAKAIRAT